MLTAESGMEAIQIVKSERILITITDIRMPNMDGIELFEIKAMMAPQLWL